MRRKDKWKEEEGKNSCKNKDRCSNKEVKQNYYKCNCKGKNNKWKRYRCKIKIKICKMPIKTIIQISKDTKKNKKSPKNNK
jgi:hypothetical protein